MRADKIFVNTPNNLSNDYTKHLVLLFELIDFT